MYLTENIDWFPGFTLTRVSSPGDGHCLMHSVAYCVFNVYRDGSFEGRPVSKFKIAKRMRIDMAKRLDKIDVKTGKKMYYIINDGALASLGEDDPEYYSLENLKNLLLGSDNLGEEIIVILEHILNINIYIIRKDIRDVVKRKTSVRGKSIIIYYSNHHYDAVMYRDPVKDEYITEFSEEHPLIQLLSDRIISSK